jgi:WD40 repeat protein
MGEVYRARDPRLERDVALKVLRPEVATDPDRLRRFEREAKTVAALNHPHILTVFDVGTHDGTPYVVTELLEGETLRQVLKTRTPNQTQILTFAVQIARGLAAAHDKDIVHRDLKPENLFLTIDGRIKILDFGLAKLTTREADFRSADTLGASEEHSTSPGVVLGTVAYMSPEQAQAHPLDNRSDIFSFGVVLYEMLARKHPFLRDTAPATLTAIVTETPADLASSGRSIPPALAGIVHRCLEKEKQDRFRGTHDLALAVEAVLQAPSGAASLQEVEERSPYPGLSSFTEKDAAVFFGREGEIEALWRKLRSRNLLAVIGPSGAGKSSFVRAGILPSRPEGWATILCTPGRHPFRRLGQALGPELTGDTEALGELAGFEDPETALSLLTRWRRAHDDALVVVDQFEELFTQSPPEAQAAFAELLGRLAKEADVHVLLSLRDDFLMRCHQHEPLARVFSELTPLDTLSRDGLRRAITEPAKKQGYAFEADALVDEMVDSVEGARGALPLLAFAVSQLWERRDREAKRLTQEAYEEIGGVAGALAQHAEHTLERIGLEREPIVRELFRNLVTAQWTRAAADREELLSVLPDRDVGGQVLDQLIDARLLTSYETEDPGPSSRGAPSESGDEGSPAPSSHTTHRIEIVHESLLKAWPRLVRWQAQDEEGAVLRDQLKQAAHLWAEKERSDDLLWSGTAFQEYQLWRGRYPGALTALEEEFTTAMAGQAARRRRRRRAIAVAVVTASLAVAAVTGVLWDRARDEARRAEAGKLLALGRSHLETDPTAALAYARGSLDLFDTPEARRFVPEVLWRGPVARVLSLEHAAEQLHLEEGERGAANLTMSPDGRWLAAKSAGQALVFFLFPHDGGPPRALPLPPDAANSGLAFGPDSDFLLAPGSGQDLRYLSLPDFREIRRVTLPGAGFGGGFVRGETLFFYDWTPERWILHALELSEGELRVVAELSNDFFLNDADPAGKEVVACAGGDPYLTVGLLSLEPPHRLRVLGQLTDRCWDLKYSPRGDRVGTTTTAAETQIWSTAEGAANPERVLRGPEFMSATNMRFDPLGRRVSQSGPYGTESVWDLDEIPETRPLVVGRPGPTAYNHAVTWDPTSRWMATGGVVRPTIDFWPVSSPRRRELPGFAADPSLTFTPDGRWLVTCAGGEGRLWPLSAEDGSARDLGGGCFSSLALHSSGQALMAPGWGWVAHLPFPGGPDHVLVRGGQGGGASVSFDRDGLRAVAVMDGDPAVRLWELPSGREQRHSLAHLLDADWSLFHDMAFAPDGTLYVAGSGGVRRLRLPDEPGGTVSGEVIHAAGMARLDLNRDGTLLLAAAGPSREPRAVLEDLLLFDLTARTSRRIATLGSQLHSARLSASGRIIVTGAGDGTVRVGPASGEEPHLLLGHRGPVIGLAISPDERWIASSSEESISIWPMPDVTQPSLHTLPHEDLMAKLDTLTNLRVVRDPSSPTGWSEDIGPFPGWKDVPTW